MRTEGSTAVVEIKRKGACSGNCVDCSGCTEQTVELSVLAEISVSPGDLVIIESEQKPVLFGLFILFVFPLILPAGCYLLARSSGYGGWFAAAAVIFAAAMILLLSKSKRFLARTKPRIRSKMSERGNL